MPSKAFREAVLNLTGWRLGCLVPRRDCDHAGLGLDCFLNAVFNYPTLSECYKIAACDAEAKLQA
jgi:hypothetical protein